MCVRTDKQSGPLIFGESFRPDFLFNPYILYNILYARCVCYTRLVVLQGYLGLLQGEKLHIYSIKNDREKTIVIYMASLFSLQR